MNRIKAILDSSIQLKYLLINVYLLGRVRGHGRVTAAFAFCCLIDPVCNDRSAVGALVGEFGECMHLHQIWFMRVVLR